MHHNFLISCFALPILIFSNHLLFDFKFRSNYRCLLCVLLELDAACAHVLPLFWASTHLWGIQVFKLPCFFWIVIHTLPPNFYAHLNLGQILSLTKIWTSLKHENEKVSLNPTFLVTLKWEDCGSFLKFPCLKPKTTSLHAWLHKIYRV